MFFTGDIYNVISLKEEGKNVNKVTNFRHYELSRIQISIVIRRPNYVRTSTNPEEVTVHTGKTTSIKF